MLYLAITKCVQKYNWKKKKKLSDSSYLFGEMEIRRTRVEDSVSLFAAGKFKNQPCDSTEKSRADSSFQNIEFTDCWCWRPRSISTDNSL